jgi:iron complex transport system ATP-binding protein
MIVKNMSSNIKATPANPNAYRLILQDVRTWRESTTILNGINWEVKPGEHWAVLGPNGSGKTSLLMALTGYLPVSRGRVFLLDGWIGRVHLPSQRKRIGIVSHPLADRFVKNAPGTTALEAILSGLHGSIGLWDEVSDEDRRRALDILAELGIAGLATKPFHVLSTGERQACMLGRSKMAANELVLLDEPCAGLDLGARERFLSSLEGILKDANCPTIVFITHHPEEIVSGITHVLLLRDGAVVAAGEKSAVMTPARLSETFGLPLRVTTDNGRYWVKP